MSSLFKYKLGNIKSFDFDTKVKEFKAGLLKYFYKSAQVPLT